MSPGTNIRTLEAYHISDHRISHALSCFVVQSLFCHPKTCRAEASQLYCCCREDESLILVWSLDTVFLWSVFHPDLTI